MEAMISFLEDLGIRVIRLFEYMGGLALLFLETLSWIGRGAIRLGLTVQQMAFLGVNSIAIVISTAAFTGMVVSLELAQLAVRYGAGQFVGRGVALGMGRELGPMLTAIVVAGRAGSAITAEIGSMKVTEQIDAMEAMATNPVKYLVVPRFLACLLMIPILTIFSDISGTVGGCEVAYALAGILRSTFWDSIRGGGVELFDVTGGLFKAMIFGAEIALISCYQGLNARGGAAGVGQATTGSVVFSMILIFITNYFLTAWLYPPV